MISIIIQGPLHENSLKTIEHYKKFGQVVVSCYHNDDTNLLPNDPDMKVVQSSLPEVRYANSGKLFYQAWSTFHGAYYCDTPLVIKTRSDESWGNIEPFVEKVLANPDQYTSCNIYFKGTQEPLHPSDHMFGCRRDYLLIGLKHIILRSLNTSIISGYDFNLDWLGPFAVAEVPMFLAFLWGKGIINKVTPQTMNQITFDNTELVNIDEMKPYIWSCTTVNGRKYWTDSSDLYHTYPSLKNKDEFWTLKYE